MVRARRARAGPRGGHALLVDRLIDRLIDRLAHAVFDQLFVDRFGDHERLSIGQEHLAGTRPRAASRIASGLPLGIMNETAIPSPATISIVMNTGWRLDENASLITSWVSGGKLCAACAESSDPALMFAVGKMSAREQEHAAREHREPADAHHAEPGLEHDARAARRAHHHARASSA